MGRSRRKPLTAESSQFEKKSLANDLLYFHDHYQCQRPTCKVRFYAKKNIRNRPPCKKCGCINIIQIPLSEVRLGEYDKYLLPQEILGK